MEENILSVIKRMPTSINKIHQSCYRSDRILRYVMNMIERGDSVQTIIDVVEFLQENGFDSDLPEKQQ